MRLTWIGAAAIFLLFPDGRVIAQPPPVGHWALAKNEVNIPPMTTELEPAVSWTGDFGHVKISKSAFIDPAQRVKQTLAVAAHEETRKNAHLVDGAERRPSRSR